MTQDTPPRFELNTSGRGGATTGAGLYHSIYALFALSLLIPTLPALVAVGLAYWGGDGRHVPWLASHRRWQIRTFWMMIAVNLVVAVVALAGSIDPLPSLLAGIFALGAFIWFVWRIARGWQRLGRREAIPDPIAFA